MDIYNEYYLVVRIICQEFVAFFFLGFYYAHSSPEPEEMPLPASTRVTGIACIIRETENLYFFCRQISSCVICPVNHKNSLFLVIYSFHRVCSLFSVKIKHV